MEARFEKSLHVGLFLLFLFFLSQEFFHKAPDHFTHFCIVIHAIMLQPLVKFLGKVHIEFSHVYMYTRNDPDC